MWASYLEKLSSLRKSGHCSSQVNLFCLVVVWLKAFGVYCWMYRTLFMPSVLWRCWLGGRKGIRPVKNWTVGCWRGGVLAWLSVWSEVLTCICPSWCCCHSLSLASVKSRLVLPFWYRLTWVVPEKGPLNGCGCVCVCIEHCSLQARGGASNIMQEKVYDSVQWGCYTIWDAILMFAQKLTWVSLIYHTEPKTKKWKKEKLKSENR